MAENSRSGGQPGGQQGGQAGQPGQGGGQQGQGAGGKPGGGQKGSAGQGVSFFTSVLTAFLFLLAVIVLSFIAGVMNGRNYNIREQNREYEQLLANGRNGQKSGPKSGNEAAAQEQKPGILKPSELEYSRLLRSSKEEKRQQQTRAQQTQQPPAQAPGQTPGQTPGQPAQPQAPVTSQDGIQPVASALPSQGQIFDYTFQVSSLKNEASVDALREKLEGAGLRTKMERRGKVFVVLVLLRGDEARAQAVRETIAAISRGTPLDLGKKPVSQ